MVRASISCLVGVFLAVLESIYYLLDEYKSCQFPWPPTKMQ